MKQRRFAIGLVLSLLLPVVVMIANAIHYGQRPILESPRFLFGNWLYMGFPQVLWGILSVVFARRLARVRLAALLALDALLIFFQLWIWYAVSGRNGADAWVFYIPLWIVVLIVAGAIGLFGARSDRVL